MLQLFWNPLGINYESTHEPFSLPQWIKHVDMATVHLPLATNFNQHARPFNELDGRGGKWWKFWDGQSA